MTSARAEIPKSCYAVITLLGDSECLHVEVEITYDLRRFRLRVRDDGRGRSPSRQIEEFVVPPVLRHRLVSYYERQQSHSDSHCG